MTTKYRERVQLPATIDLRALTRYRAFVDEKVGIGYEMAEIETKSHKIEEPTLDEAIEAIGEVDERTTVELALFTCNDDELAVAFAVGDSPGRFRRRSAHVEVRGTDELRVLGLAECLRRFTDKRRYEETLQRRRDEPRRAPAAAPIERTAWWREMTVATVAEVLAFLVLTLMTVVWFGIR